MTRGWVRASVLGLALGGLLGGPAASQEASRDDLKREIQSLRDALQAIQKDVQDIKAMLARQVPPPSGLNVVLDLGANVVKGDRSARLTLVEFSDYQCPFCARYVRDTYPQIDTEYVKTGKLQYVFLDMPLENIHKLAFKAAEAAHCAGDQGRYWEMHDRLFQSQKTLEPWGAHAEALGLDVGGFEQCLASGKFAEEIRRDMAEARKAGVTGTPAFMLARAEPNSTKVRTVAVLKGAKPFADFKAEIDRLLAEPERAPAQDAKK